MPRPRVSIVQPFVPGYRVPLFTRLAADLDRRGIDLVVAHGTPVGHRGHRNNAGTVPGAVQLRQVAVPLAGSHLVWRGLRSLARTSDVLVLQHALHTTESYGPLLRGRLGRGPRVALWGQGGAYAYRPHPLAHRAKVAVTGLADWFFAYTESGRRDVAGWGFPADRVTVVRNSIDTRALLDARAEITRAETDAFRGQHGLVPGRTAYFVGGLDGPKRIPYLLAAAEEIAAQLPGFRLLVAGDGRQRPLVQEAARDGGAVVWVGHADARLKALLGAVSEVLLMPGSIGLCAVDSLVLRTPVVTTDWPYHGVEFEYLRHGRNALVAGGDEHTYATAVAGLLRDRGRLARLRAACGEDAAGYGLEDMSERFAGGLERLLGAPRRPLRGRAAGGGVRP